MTVIGHERPTLLIVDDHPPFRRRARQLLERDGFAIAGEAGTGADALRLTAELRPDVVLLDVGLPDMSGFEVARQIAGTTAVVLTSTHEAADFGPLLDGLAFIAKSELDGPTLRRLVG